MPQTFPTAFFAPRGLTPRLVGASSAAGRSLSGITQRAMTSGGGYWMFDFDNVTLWTREKWKTFMAFMGLTDFGATPFIVPLCDRRGGPFADPKRGAGVGNSDDSTFSDGATWAGELIEASLDGSAALRATTISILIAGAADLQGWEPFTIWHLGMGQRMYEIVRVRSQGGGAATIDIRPPLREACADGVTLDFDNPRCTMCAVGDVAASLEDLRFGSAKVSFVETFMPVE